MRDFNLVDDVVTAMMLAAISEKSGGEVTTWWPEHINLREWQPS